MGLKRASLLRNRTAISCCTLLLIAVSAAQNQPSQATSDWALPQNPAPEINLTNLNRFSGMRVSSVEVKTPVPMHEDALQQLLIQKAGEPFDKSKVRRTIQALYDTGRFADIEVQAQQSGNEIALTFRATENYFIGFVAIVGFPNPPTGQDLLNASKLQLGELFTPEKLRDALQRMKQLMETNGYYQSTITAQQAPNPATQQTDMRFQVTPGPQAVIGKVTFTGNTGRTEQQMEDISHFHPGDHVTSARLTRALQRLRSHYQGEDRLEAQVTLVDRTYHPDTNSVEYHFAVEAGAKVDVRLEGASVSRSKLKKLVPVFEENAVDDDLLNEGRRNLRDYFQSLGHFDSTVDWERQADKRNDRLNVVYSVQLGKKHKVTNVEVIGNHYFPTDLIRERLLVHPAGLVVLASGRYSESAVNHDIAAIETLYRSNGFQQVKVTREVIDDYHGDSGRMYVAYHIDEGPQTLVGRITIIGNQSIPRERFLVDSVMGQPYSENGVALDRDTISNLYFNSGFPDVQVNAEVAPDQGEPLRVNIVYRIEEGERVLVDRVLFYGLRYTRRDVVEREFRLWEGDPLSQAAELDTQRRLYDLGLFNEVDMAVQNPEGRATHKDLLVQYDEAKRYTFNYGIGFEAQTGLGVTTCPGPSNSPTVVRCKAEVAATNTIGVSPRVSFDVSRINFRGRDHTISLKSHYGRLEQRALLSYEAPRLFDKPRLKGTFNALYDNSRQIFTFRSQRLEGSVQVEQRWSRVTTTLYRFTYRLVKATELETSSQGGSNAAPALTLSEIPLLSQPVRVGIPSFTYIRDKRDNVLQTTHGNYTTADFGVASGVFGSQANFMRAYVENSTYVSFRKLGGTWVIARSTRIGVEQPYGSGLNVTAPVTPNTTCNPAATGSNAGCAGIIPLPERFFAGGANTHRGFPLNQAGPRDPVSGDPIGGGGLFLNLVELRAPPLSLPFIENNMSLVLFEDAGNVFARANDVGRSLIRWHQPDIASCIAAAQPNSTGTCNFDYLSHAIGVGIRYRTPVGPVRVDFGYNLNPPFFAERDLNCPTNTTCPANQPSPFQRQGRFTVSFSIGQTF
jgi:outer membrane protein insertion porin family